MNQLESLRFKITKIDVEIIQLIAKRLSLAVEIGALKQEQGLPVLDAEREKRLREFHAQLAYDCGASHNLVTKIFNLLIRESRRLQDGGK